MNALSGTGTPAPGALPTAQPSPLLAFADSVNAAVDLARKKRSAAQLDIMAPFQGTVAASDFGSILSNMNRASERSAADLIETVTKANEVKFDTLSIGGDLYQVQKDSTGQIIGEPKLILKDPSPPGGIRSGSLVYSPTDYADDAKVLEQSRGPDGWVDSDVYLKLYNAWIASGGIVNDFLAKFPPKNYINPANDALPAFLQNKTGGIEAEINNL